MIILIFLLTVAEKQQQTSISNCRDIDLFVRNSLDLNEFISAVLIQDNKIR